MNKEYYLKGEQIVQDAPQLYVDLDVEADGKPGYGSLLSVGAVTPMGDEFYREIKPTSQVWVPHQRQFCEEHGLQRERLLQEGLHPALAMRELNEWTRELQTEYRKIGSVLTGFNVGFDHSWIDLQMTRANIKSPYGVAGYDLKSLAQRVTGDYDWRNTSKDKLPPDILPEGDFTHHALEDARYQQKLHFALAGKLAIMQEAAEVTAPEGEAEPNAYHLDIDGTLFECGRHGPGHDCMESMFGGDTYFLTQKELKNFDPDTYWKQR